MILVLEVAQGDATRARGLMDRVSLPPGVDGMLFVFDRPTTGAFWNVRTLMPLDVLFLGPGLVVLGRAALPSILETRGVVHEVRPPAPYVAAIEVPRDHSAADLPDGSWLLPSLMLDYPRAAFRAVVPASLPGRSRL